ncbi:hypothetical protein DHEL01_v207084 [Diaporthe helianthi]|uniref:Uncharacterized protein n=1 Tax=Diaporthe helianthi TaxID=158607 RepID=A0A2P5HW87_DIAHE|nr:hypothetical protein DHEL01_v207084 [Diaporthe helianthi]
MKMTAIPPRAPATVIHSAWPSMAVEETGPRTPGFVWATEEDDDDINLLYPAQVAPAAEHQLTRELARQIDGCQCGVARRPSH